VYGSPVHRVGRQYREREHHHLRAHQLL